MKESLKGEEKKGIIKEEAEFNKGIELVNEWRRTRWPRIARPMTKPIKKWAMNILLKPVDDQ